MEKFLLFTISFLSSVIVFGQQTKITLKPTNISVPAEKMQEFTDYEIIHADHKELYDLWASEQDLIQFQLKSQTTTIDFELSPYDMRSKGYVLVSGDGQSNKTKSYPKLATSQFKGIVNRDGNTTAIITIDEDYFIAYWQSGNSEHFIEPLSRFWKEAPQNTYVKYTAAQVAPTSATCGTTAKSQHATRRESLEKVRLGECIEVEMALAADYELYQEFNSVASVENFMLNSLALVQTNYDSQTGDNEFDDEIKFTVTNTYIATSSATDPWTNDLDPGVLLPDFRDWGNSGNFSNPFDIACLWSARDFTGSTVGLAYVGVICSGSRYNVLERFNSNSASLRVLWAHELGHNFSALHDDVTGFIMSPSVNSTNTWSQTSRDDINAHYQGVSCLANCPQSAPVASFSNNYSSICPGNSISFSNETTGAASSIQWSFPGGSPSSSSDANPTVTYNTAGTYTATLTVTNSAGSDSKQVQINVGNGFTTVLLSENFEDRTFGDLSISNPDNSDTWAIKSTAGNGSNNSAYVNNYEYQAQGQVDGLVLPTQDVSELSGLRLQFEYAYARYQSTSEELRVSVTAGGTTTVVFSGSETGSGNFATANDTSSPFTPSSADDWCENGPSCIDIDLSAYDGQSALQIAIENVNNFGNNLYIDNIILTATCTPPVLPVEWLSFNAYPENNKALLKWSVNQDELHEGFVIERLVSNSTDSSWKRVGYVSSTGHAAQQIDYSFVDYEVSNNQNYLYRIRQQDIDGTEQLSVIRSVSFGQLDRKATIWPNPTDGQFSLQTAQNSGVYHVLDSQGRIVRKGDINDYNTLVDIKSLIKGLYFVRILDQGAVTIDVLKVLKQ